MTTESIVTFGALAFTTLEAVAILTAVHAVMHGRTSQGAIAWAISLVTFPFVTLPLYWVFGRHRFQGYVEVMRSGREGSSEQVERLMQLVRGDRVAGDLHADLNVFASLADAPFTCDNRVDLLVDGPATFAAMFTAMKAARQYILLEYFIVHDDRLGRDLQALLIRKARAGVRVLFLYDEVGCNKLPPGYLQELEAAGAEVSAFRTTRGSGNRFQLNFRNHRKITVVDGQTAFVGGHNVGDEYMGRNPRFGRWRDTHLCIEGPAVRNVQIVFLQDWYWATRRKPTLRWQPESPPEAREKLLVLPTGPVDALDACSLLFVHAIHMARRRLWIASPYFVPNEAVVEALQVAALRGVDVRIMLPLKPDHRVVYLAGFWYLARLDLPNISFHRYAGGFLHQKVILTDDTLAVVGTANADNRSFQLNFEISILGAGGDFTAAVAAMLEEDFAACKRTGAEDYHRRSWFFKLGVKLARLLSPIL